MGYAAWDYAWDQLLLACIDRDPAEQRATMLRAVRVRRLNPAEFWAYPDLRRLHLPTEWMS